MSKKDNTPVIEESATCAIYPLAAALDKADDEIGKGRVWTGEKNDNQRLFIPIFNRIREEARSLKEIESVSSRDAGVLNKFLADRGFQIALEPFRRPTDFGMASVLDLLVEWQEKGQKVEIVSGRDGRTSYPGVYLNCGVTFAKSLLHHNPIAVINTESGDKIFMMKCNRTEGFNQFYLANDLGHDLRPIRAFRGVRFPMVDLNQMVDISWLKDLRTVGDDQHEYEIKQALQQTKFRMNEEGAKAESGVAIGVIRATSVSPRQMPPLIINEPFLLWISRPNITYPLFTAWISEKNWKAPKGIDKK